MLEGSGYRLCTRYIGSGQGGLNLKSQLSWHAYEVVVQIERTVIPKEHITLHRGCIRDFGNDSDMQ